MLDDKTDPNDLPEDKNTDIYALLAEDDEDDDDEDYLPWGVKMGIAISAALFQKALESMDEEDEDESDDET